MQVTSYINGPVNDISTHVQAFSALIVNLSEEDVSARTVSLLATLVDIERVPGAPIQRQSGNSRPVRE